MGCRALLERYFYHFLLCLIIEATVLFFVNLKLYFIWKGALNSSSTTAMEKSVQEPGTTLGLHHHKRSRCVTATSSTVSTGKVKT
jgi:hypothetical protein